jgi:hypothetical protein
MTMIGTTWMGEGRLIFFLRFFFVFSRHKNKQKQNTDCIRYILLYLFVIYLIKDDATEGLTQGNASLYTIRTALIQC